MIVGLDLLNIIGNLYSASTDPAMWDVVVRQLAELFACHAAVLFLVDNQAITTLQPIAFEFPEETMHEYAADTLKICPRYRAHLDHPERKVLFDYQHTEEAEIDHDPFYNWLDKSAGVRYYLGTMLDVDRHTQLAITLHHTRDEGHFQRSDIELFAALLPHFERTVQMRARLGYLDVRAQAMEAALDRISCAVVILNTSGIVAMANYAAETLFKGADGLGIEKGTLTARHRRDNERLQRKIHEVLETSVQTGTDAGGTVIVRRPSGRRSYSLLVAPVPRREILFVVDCPGAIVFIVDPEDMKEPAIDQLKNQFGLTPTEASVAVQLCAGNRLEDVANAMGISTETARTHLKQIFSKTGVHRQADLLRLLAHIAGIVS